MDEENRTLAVFDGDASGAKRAAQETVSAFTQVAAAHDALAAAEKQHEDSQGLGLKSSSRGPIHGGRGKIDWGVPATEIKESEQAVEQVTKATERANESFGKGQRNANMLAEAVSRINPQAGALARTLGNVDELMAAAFSPAGLMTGGLLAALTAVSVVVETIQSSIAKTKQELADLEVAKARVAREKLEAAGEVGKALAEHGAGSEGALERATEQAQKTEKEGFERSAAVQVAAASEAAGITLTDEDRRRLAMGVKLGAVNLQTGRSPSETLSNVRGSLEKLGGMNPELQSAIEAAIEQTMRGNSLYNLREAATGTQGVTEEVLKELHPQLDGDTLKGQADKLRDALDWIRKGRPVRPVVDMVDLDQTGAMPASHEAHIQTPKEAEAEHKEGLDMLASIEADIKRRQADLQAQEARVRKIIIDAAANPSPNRQFSNDQENNDLEPGERQWSDTFKKDRQERTPVQIEPWEGKRGIDPEAKNRPQKVVNNYNYNSYQSGIINNGPRDPRFSRGTRIPTR